MFLDILLIGIALAMDAFAVTLSSAMTYPNLKGKKRFSLPVSFAVFQGGMPVLGYFLGCIFSGFLCKYSGIITCIILLIIGGGMVKDGIKGEDEDEKEFSFKVLLLLAIATSIDAFAVGVGFAAMGAEVFSSSLIIAISTLVITTIGLYLGKFAGEKLGDKSVIIGGLVLVIIGIKSLF